MAQAPISFPLWGLLVMTFNAPHGGPAPFGKARAATFMNKVTIAYDHF